MGKDNMTQGDKVFLKQLAEDEEDFSKREKSLKERSYDLGVELKNLKIEKLKWLGRMIQIFLMGKGFSGVKVGYAYGKKDSVESDPDFYCDFSELKDLFPQDMRPCPFWIRIQFRIPGGLLGSSFDPEIMIIFRRIWEDEIRAKSLPKIVNGFFLWYASLFRKNKND